MIDAAISDVEAERYVLAHMVFSADAYRQGLSRLSGDDFVDAFNRSWFNTLKLFGQIECLEVRMIEAARYLGRGKIHGASHVGRLMVNYGALHRVPNVFRYYVRRVIECSQRRQMTRVAVDLNALASDGDEDWLSAAKNRIGQIAERAMSVHGPNVIGDTIADTIDQIDKDRSSEKMLGTGLRNVDEQLGGICRGENIVIAASTGFGKTALALSIAVHNAKKGRSVLYFSLEMEQSDLHKRVLAHECEINLSTIFRSGHSPDERRAMVQKSTEIANWKLGFSDNPRLTISRIREVCMEYMQTIGIDLIVVDYLQLTIPDNPRAPLREQVSQVSRDLKLIAREFKSPLLTLCQLSREGAKNDEPYLWHLKESGSIENDADMVWFIYDRSDVEPTEVIGKGTIPVWLKCAKNRRGPIGKFPLHFVKPFQQFRAVHDASKNPFNEALGEEEF